MRRIESILMLAFIGTSAHAQFSSCLQLFPNQKPPKVVVKQERLREVCFESFAVLHSGQTKTPVYVVEKLTRDQLIDALDEHRTDRFYQEGRLPLADRATPEDYKKSGWDRGHMAPAGDMPSPSAMAQSFSMANMIPQAPKLNRGIWADIEKNTRSYVKRANGPVYVFTGPIYEAPVSKIGNGEVWVPKYTFKLVFDQAANKSWVYWLENTNTVRMTKPISYQEFVSKTNMKLLGD